MEEIKNKTKVDELDELMEKISIAMDMTKDKQNNIDKMTDELYNETRPMMVEKMKKEIEQVQNNKIEFDEMTENALINAKKSILEIKEASEKVYQDKLLETLKRKQEIDRKLSSIKMREYPQEKIIAAETYANSAMEKVNAEMEEIKKAHFKLGKKLSEYEKNIWDNAVELGVEQKIDAVTLENEKIEPEETETGKEEPVKAEPTKVEPIKAEPVKPEPKKVEPIKAEPVKPEPKKVEPIKAEPVKPEPKKVEPIKAESVKSEPKKVEPIKAEPVKPVQKKVEPKKVEQIKTEQEKNEKKQITAIAINPFESQIFYNYKKGKSNMEICESEEIPFNYDHENKEGVIKVLKQYYDEEQLDDIAQSIDPNITKWLSRHSDYDINITDYLNILNGYNDNINVLYDLRDIYNSNLNRKQIKNAINIAKNASITSEGRVEVRKDPLLKRMYGNIKKRVEDLHTKLLYPGNKKDKEFNTAKTTNNTSSDRNKEFVPKAKVDENKAKNNAEAKSKENEEVMEIDTSSWFDGEEK